jgi:hypothetical protein
VGKRERLRELLDRPSRRTVDAALAASLKREIDPVSDAHFRKLLRESGAPLDPLVEGIRQDTFENFERTFLALIAHPAEDAVKRREIIRSRDHARFAARRKPSPEREEMILWMTVWLENPPIFAEWLRLRKAIAARSSSP